MTPQWPAPTPRKIDKARRRAARKAIDISGSLSGRVRRPVTVVDLSLTGCLVRGEAAFDHGAILDLRLDLSARPLDIKVQVVDCSVEGESLASGRPHYLTGLQYLGLPAGAADRLARLLTTERRRRGGALPPTS